MPAQVACLLLGVNRSWGLPGEDEEVVLEQLDQTACILLGGDKRWARLGEIGTSGEVEAGV